MNKKMNLLGTFLKIGLSVAVALYLASHSLSFFTFGFGDGFNAYLGFSLTGGGLLVYLMVFKYGASTPLQKVVALSMTLICLIGELVTAGFGFQVDAYRAQGISFTQDELDFMISAIKLLALLHGVALVMDFAGDEVIAFFKNDDDAPIPAPVEWVHKNADTDFFGDPRKGGEK